MNQPVKACRPRRGAAPRDRGFARALAIVTALAAAAPAAFAQTAPPIVFGDWRADAPGARHRIRSDDLPAPFATPSAGNGVSVVDRPANAAPRVPAGFDVAPLATGLQGPRVLRVAPNGDVFVAETGAGRIRVLRAADGGARPARVQVFAERLDGPFGIAFFPARDPRWVYVANRDSVVRFAYREGDLRASGPARVVVARLCESRGGHSTRDIAFSPDGQRLFVSVGSQSNVAQGLPRKSAAEIRAWEAERGLGAAWGDEADRADVLAFDPEGGNRRVFATGLRNCTGLAVQPAGGALWCATNERDGLGDDLVPDHATRVREGAFYGWPWYYIGAHEDPRQAGARPDLAGKVTLPDVLLQPHSAALAIAFYDNAGGSAAFPAAYRGDAFVALHGSWNRSRRTGYKVVRLLMKDGIPTGEYEDFLTGFVVDDDSAWGRPAGVAVAKDGALLVSEDGNGTIWRVAPAGR